MDSSQKKQALISSLRILSATPKSRHEMTKRLQDKGYHKDVIQETLDQLEAQGILNDKAFAEDLKTRFIHGKPSGSRKIEFELKRKGITDAVRRDILDSLDVEAEERRARELGLERWSKLTSLQSDKRKKRVFDFLLRRGFEYSLVRNLIEEFGRTPDEG